LEFWPFLGSFGLLGKKIFAGPLRQRALQALSHGIGANYSKNLNPTTNPIVKYCSIIIEPDLMSIMEIVEKCYLFIL